MCNIESIWSQDYFRNLGQVLVSGYFGKTGSPTPAFFSKLLTSERHAVPLHIVDESEYSASLNI